MADYNLGTAHGKVVIDDDTKGVDRADAKLTGLQKTGATTGEGFKKLSTGMIAAGAGIALGIGAAIKSAADFEQTLSGIKAVTGATTAQMEQVRAKALQLGKDTKFSASEAAQAMEELAKAGVSIPDIMNGAADATVALAAAGEISLPRAAEIAAAAMNTFSLKAQDLPHVADQISGAANASAISVDEFAQSMQQSGAAAALVGVSFDDLAVAIAEMGNAGIKGSDAGTSLKTFLQNLQPDTVKQTKLFKQLGLITEKGGNQFFDASGKLKSLSDVAQILQDSLKGMTNQQKQAALQTLFGSDAIRAAAIISKNGAAGFDKLSESMGKVTAESVAATRMDNLKGSIEQLKGSLETAAITIGSIVIPAIRGLVDGVNTLVGAFLALSPGAQSAALNIAAAAGAFLLVGGAALKVTAFLSRLPTILASVRAGFITMWASALGPVGIIVGLILALAAAIFILYQRFQPVRDVVNAVGSFLASTFGPILAQVILGVQNFIRVLQGTAAGGTGFVGFMGRLGAILRDVVIPALIATGQFLVATFGPIIRQVISIVGGFITAIIGYFQSISPQLASIGNAIRAVWNAIWPPLLAIVQVVLPLIVNFIKSTLQLLAIGIRVLLAGIANIFRGVFNIIGGIVKIFLSILTGNWSGALNGLVQIAKGVWQIIKGIFQSVLGGAIVLIAVSSLKIIGSVFRAGFSLIRSVVTGGMSAVRAVFQGAMSAISAVARAGTAVVRGAFNALSAIRGIVSGIMNGVLGVIRSVLGSAVGVVTGALGRVVSAVAGFAGRMFAAGANIVGSLISGLTSKLGGLISIAQKVAGVIAKVLPGSPVREGPLRVLNNGHAGKSIVDMLIAGIASKQGQARAEMSRLAAGMGNELNNLANAQALSVMASLGVAGAASAASTPGGGVGSATGTSGPFAAASSTPATDAIAAAVVSGLAGAKFIVDKDGVGRIVADSLIPGFAMGGV